MTLRRRIQWSRNKNEESVWNNGLKTQEERTIPLSTLAKQAMLEWKELSGAESGPLFHIDGAPIPYRKIEYRYTQAMKAAGLSTRATHVLRHVSITGYQNEVKNIALTQAVAGHVDIETTMDYVHADKKELMAAQRKIDRKQRKLAA